MKCYIAFSISGTNCFIIATKEMDDVPEGFTIVKSRDPKHNEEHIKLIWDKLITKTGNPLRSPQMIVHHFNNLAKKGWFVDKENFVKKHFKK